MKYVHVGVSARVAHSATYVSRTFIQWLHHTAPLFPSRRFSRIEYSMDTALVSAPDPAVNLLHSMDTALGTMKTKPFRGITSMGIAWQSPQNSLPRQSTSKFKPRLFQTEIAGTQHPKPIAQSQAG